MVHCSPAILLPFFPRTVSLLESPAGMVLLRGYLTRRNAQPSKDLGFACVGRFCAGQNT